MSYHQKTLSNHSLRRYLQLVRHLFLRLISFFFILNPAVCNAGVLSYLGLAADVGVNAKAGSQIIAGKQSEKSSPPNSKVPQHESKSFNQSAEKTKVISPPSLDSRDLHLNRSINIQNDPPSQVQVLPGSDLLSIRDTNQSLAQGNPKSKLVTDSVDSSPAKEVISVLPPNVVDPKRDLRNQVSFNSWAKEKGVSNALDNIPIPIQGDDSSWMKMEVSPDLPPRVAILGEDLIGAVSKQLPSSRAKQLAMPYDEFKFRVRDAVLAYPDVAAAQSQLGFAQAGAAGARAPLLPQISGFSDSGNRTVGSDPYLGTPAYNRDGTNYGISVRQVLFDFGAAIFGMQAGKAKERAAQELLNSKRSEQTLTTVASVIDLERARALMLMAKENVSSRLSIVKLVRERYELGGGSKPDIIRAEARYAESLATLTNYQTRLKAAEAGYRQAFAANPIGIIRGPNFEVPVPSLDVTAEKMAVSYPGLQQLAQLRDSADSEASAAIARLLPNFTFVYDNVQNGAYGAPLQPTSSTSAVIQLRYNFYTGGSETAQKDQAKYRALQAEQEFQSGLRQYERVLSQNQADVRNSDDLVSARKVAATSAISSMRAVREQFAFNKGTLLDLLTVQEGLFNAGRDLVDAEADRQISRYRYLHLTSGLDKLFDLSEGNVDATNTAAQSAVSQ